MESINTFQATPQQNNPNNNHSHSATQSDRASLADEQLTYPVERFEDLGLKEDLMRGIFAYGWEAPSSIQQRAIRPLTAGRNTYCQACAGQGKTGVFVTAAFQAVDESVPHVQAIVIAPTIELAKQSYNVFLAIGKYLPIKVHLSAGGVKLAEERAAYKNASSAPVQIVVGTPGRICDLLAKGWLDASHVKMLLLDEADQLLEFGFTEQIQAIFKASPQDVQAGLFSATMPEKAVGIAEGFMDNAIKILTTDNKKVATDKVKQYFVSFTTDEEKQGILIELLKMLDVQLCIIYLNSVDRVNRLADFLRTYGIDALKIHGKMTREERDAVIDDFRSAQKSRYLLASDLLARGIDVKQVNVVFNYDITPSKETYIHRMGRAGRQSAIGVTINFVTPRDAVTLCDIEKHYNFKIEELPVDVS